MSETVITVGLPFKTHEGPMVLGATHPPDWVRRSLKGVRTPYTDSSPMWCSL